MNLQEIAIKKLNSILIDKNYIPNENIKTQLQVEAMKIGFMFSDTACSYLSANTNLFSEIFLVLNELVGNNKKWKPFYVNFPDEVFEKSEIDLYTNAITHYLSGGKFLLDSISNKIPTFESVDFKIINTCTFQDIENLYKNIVSSNGSITDYDKKVIEYGIKNSSNVFQNLDIKFKETLCYVIGILFENNISLSKYPVKTATDVLRIACHFSNSDISLAIKPYFKLSNKQRKFIVSLLENTITEEEVAKHKDFWIHLFHHLHIGTFKFAKKSNFIAKKLRESKIRTNNSLIETSLVKKDVKQLISLLPKNMGDFGRRLDYILREFTDINFVITFFENVSKVDTRVLVQMLSHFKFRDERDMRIVIPKGITTRATLLPINKTIPKIMIDLIVSNLEKELKNRFSLKDSLGDVYISEDLKKAPIPLQMRAASDGLFVMNRGTRLNLGNKSILRFFIHWIGSDVDLSACFLTENLEYHSDIAYYNLVNQSGCKSCHSGDITYAPAPNGACEFIDIDLDSITDKSIRYIAMDVRVYSGGHFPEQQANAGWMMRDTLGSKGEIFDAKTVEQRISISAKRNVIVALFDVKNREVIWLDMEGSSRSMMTGNNASNNKASIRDIAKMAVNFKNLSIYDLLKLHVDSRGTIVNKKENSNIIFDKDLIFNHIEILSKYL